jgi:hypothetical protein
VWTTTRRDALGALSMPAAGDCVAVRTGATARPLWHVSVVVPHVIVGAGTGPCLVIAVGARAHDELGFPADDTAKRHGASVDEDTMNGGVAYAALPPREPTAYREGWLP